MENMHLREQYEIKCKGMTRSRKDSLEREVKVGIEIFQNRQTNPDSVDSVVHCPHITEDKRCAVSIDVTVDDKPKGDGACKKYVSFTESGGDFSFEDYNDKPKLALKKNVQDWSYQLGMLILVNVTDVMKKLIGINCLKHLHNKR